VGEPVERTGQALSVELGPGMLAKAFDGVQRPLELIRTEAGDFITRGIDVPALDPETLWDFNPTVSAGDRVELGDVLGEVQETKSLVHRIMVPPCLRGRFHLTPEDADEKFTVVSVEKGKHRIYDTIAVLRDDGGHEFQVQMAHRWPVRIPRPVERKLLPEVPLITGSRVLDFFFPVALGGNAAIPGGFGTGKTVTEQTLAKSAKVDTVIYIGCGERGNEMTEVLAEFPELQDPTRPGSPLMDRTILVVNTSNMPVAAREASIYTGITMAEYLRDMGYNVLLLADSTSRWAEALREMSSRLEEMPGEEGYPTYLSSKLAAFYERTGRTYPLGGRDQIGSVTAVGAVSPQGGDFSEPVTQSTLRVVGAFWALDSDLARRRHYPAINWLTSYTLYYNLVAKWFNETSGVDWTGYRNWASEMLQKDAELREIVQLVGPDALEDTERVLLETGSLLREAFLQQNSFHEIDYSCSMSKIIMILSLIRSFSEIAMSAVREGRFHAEDLHALPEIEDIARLKELPDQEAEVSSKEILRSLKEKLVA